MKKLQKLSLLFLIALFIFLGCEVGLGSSIDVEAPLIKIEYPPEAAVARGNLLVKGTCSDDQKISAVYVRIVNSKTEVATDYQLATFDDISWSINFDTTKFIDGKYSVQAYSVDGTEKESLISFRSFDIDNTAPVLILGSPLGLSGNTPSTYGRVLKLAGDISDEHTVTSLKFNFKRTDDDVIESIDIADFKNMSAEEPLVIAQYYDEGDPKTDQTLLDNYKKIYGDIDTRSSSFDDKTVYCTIELTDEAKIYDGSENYGNGNISNRYYINTTEFYNTLMSEKTHGLTATRLMKILNGTYEDSDADEILSTINDVSNKFYVETDALTTNSVTSVFKLNPENNPVFLVGGYVIEKDKNNNPIYNKFNMGTDLMLTVEVGKDKVYINEQSLVVTFTREDGEIYSPVLAWDSGDKVDSISKVIVIKGNEATDPKDSHGNYFFKQGNRYTIEITGTDVNSVEILPKESAIYGFELATTSAPAKMETTFGENYYSPRDLESDITVDLLISEDNASFFSNSHEKGDILNSSDFDYSRFDIKGLNVTKISGENENYSNIKLEIKSVKITSVTKHTTDDYYNYGIELKIGYKDDNKLVAGNGKYKFIFTVAVRDTNNQVTTLDIPFYVDCNTPEIGGFEDAENTVVNGSFEIKGTVKDNDEIKVVKYSINGGEEKTFEDKANPSIIIDTTKRYESGEHKGEYIYADNSTLTITITAYDKVENFAEKVLIYKINQESDKPEIHGSNFDISISNTDDVKVVDGKTKNIFTSTDRLTGYISDDDGDLTSTEIHFYTLNEETKEYTSEVIPEEQASLPLENGKTFSNIKLPSEAGIYKVFIKVIDGPKEDTNYNSAEENFYIAIDNNAPTIREKNYTDVEAYTNGEITYYLELGDDWDESKLKDNISIIVTQLTKNGDALSDSEIITLTPKITKDISGTKGTIKVDLSKDTDDVVYPEEKYQIKFIVEDRAGKKADLIRTVRKETGNPTLSNTKFKETSTNGYYGISELTVEGSAFDSVSGIEKVEYQLNNNSFTPLSITPTGTSATFSGLISGLNNNDKIKVKATDKAGNTSALTELNIKIDTTAPVLNNVRDGGNNIADEYRFNSTTTKTIEFDVVDSESGVNLEDIISSVSGSTITKKDTDTYTLSIPAGKITQTGAIYVTVKDGVGNSKDYKLCNIIYDNTLPEADIRNIKYYNTENNLPSEEDKASGMVTYSDANGKVTISGIAKDTELYSVWCEYSTDGENFNKFTEEQTGENKFISKKEITDEPSSWSFDLNTTSLGTVSSVTYYFRVGAKDKTGNIGYSTTNIVIINQDSDRPKINFTSTKYDSADDVSWLKQTKTLYFSVEDDDGDVDVYWKKDGDINYNLVSNNSITFDDDGEKVICFKVVEKNTETEKTFESSAEFKPKLFGNDGIQYTDAKLKVNVDTVVPVVNKLKYASKNGNTPIKTSDYNSSSKDVVFGGSHKTFNLQFTAKDENGIKTVELYKNGTKITNNSKTYTNNEYKNSSENTITIEDIDVSGLTTGNHEYEFIVYDYAGMSRKTKFNVTVDNTEPEIKTDSHQHLELVGTKFTIKGSVDGADAGSSIKYIVNKTPSDISVNDPAWNNASTFTNNDSVSTWRLYVDGDINNSGTESMPETHTKSHKEYFVEQYGSATDSGTPYGIMINGEGKIKIKNSETTAGDTDYETIKPLYFHFLVSDKAGNKGTTTLALMIDPQGDIPTVRMDSPAMTDYAWYCDDSDLEEGSKWITTKTPGESFDSTKYVEGHTYKYQGKTVTLSGTISAQGIAEAKEGRTIEAVYMQIDPAFDPTAQVSTRFNSWKGATKPDIKFPGNAAQGSRNTSLPNEDYTVEPFTALNNGNATSDSLWGIKVDGESSWSKTINKNNIFGYATGSNIISIRLYAKDSSGKVTTLNPLNDLLVTIDSEAPIIGQQEPFYLYQYAWVNNGLTPSVVYTKTSVPDPEALDKAYTDSGCNDNETAITDVTDTKITTSVGEYTKSFISKAYDEGDAWITGQWWLRFSVHDQQDVYEIKVGNETVVTDNTTGSDYTAAGTNSTVERKTWNDGTDKGFIVNYRVGTENEGEYGKVDLSITAKDYKEDPDERKPSRRELTVKYDNKKPEVITSGQLFNIGDYIVNNQGAYDFGTAATESATESGFKAVLYYFKQKNENKIYLLSKTGTTKNYLSYTGDKEVYVNTTGLQVTAISGNKVTVSDTTDYSVGDMVLFGGNYYVITEKTGTYLTLDGKPSASLKNEKLYSVIGKVITKDSSNVTSSNGRYLWTAEIDSNTLPDGPIELNYLVFDKAGNITHNKVDAIVGNNAPRVASVRVWCDYNKNGTKQPQEYKDYFYEERTVGSTTKAGEAASNLLVVGDTTVGSRKVQYSFPTKSADPDSAPFMTVNDVFKITPEIVGGNGELKYSYVVANRNKVIDAYANGDYNWSSADIKKIDTPFGTSTIDGTVSTSYLSGGQVTGQSFENALTVNTEDISSILNDDTDGNKVTYFEFTIWDSTDNLTVFTNSLHAKIQLALKVQYRDIQAPVVHIGKFGYSTDGEYTQDENGYTITRKYTEGTGASAVTIPYSHVYGMDLTKGHVELPEDWIQTSKYSSSKTAGSWTDTSNTKKTSEFDADPKVSGYVTIRGTAYDNVAINSLQVKFPGIATNYVTVASNTYGVMTPADAYTDTKDGDGNVTAAAIASSGIRFTIVNETYDATGHYIEWQCDIDTAKVDSTNHVKIDSDFELKAVPARGTEMTSGSVLTMDVVPYITKVTRTTARTDIAEKYWRTARGHYPLYASAQGFNATSHAKQEAKNEVATIKGFNMADQTFTVNDSTPSSGTDGYIFTPVNGISTLNNYNLSTVVYNQVDSEIHKVLSDDVFFDVWDINSKAAVPYDNMILDASMKINPVNGLIGFAFANGKYNFALPDAATSYNGAKVGAYDFCQSTSLTYNSLGNSFGTTAGGQTNNSNADTFGLYSSLWTANNRTQNSGGKIRLNQIGQKGVKGSDEDNNDYFVKKRFVSPSIATYVDSTDSNNPKRYTYLAYYDKFNKEIRFHAGILGETSPDKGDKYGTFIDNFTGNQDEEDGPARVIKRYDSINHQILAEEDTAGEYVSIAATSDNSVVMVWYNSSEKSLYYSYKKAMFDENNNFITTTGVNRTGWEDAVKLTGDLIAGQYCQVVVAKNDSGNDSVHIACNDKTNSALRYINIPDYKVPGTRKSCLVDSYLSVGTQITLDVASDGTYQIPYIGYWANTPSKPRYAYLAEPSKFYTSTTTESEYSGVDSDKFTGTWEVTVVPTTSAVYQTQYSPVRMNVGVWKNASGVLTESYYKESDTSTRKNNWNYSTASTTTGKCYGNGSNNGVMGYVIKTPNNSSSTWMEVAQMRGASIATR